MATLILKELAKKMAGIDFVMMSTLTPGGDIAARPMSTNGDVEYDGDSWFFTFEDSHVVAEATLEPKVSLTFTGAKHVMSKSQLFVAVEGDAELIRDKALFKQHWVSSLERYFKDGIDTPGIVLIKVHATRIHWWEGEESGEIRP